MTRKGKIARLPLAVRQELNQRLQNGQKGRQLVAWLNGLPEVQAVVASEFNGQPVAECNLTRWKNGGYRCWEEEQNAREAAAALIKESPAPQDLAKEGLSKRISAILIAQLVVDLGRLDFIPPGATKSRRQHDLLDRFVALRRGDLEGERLHLERRRIDFRRELNNMKPQEEFATPAETKSDCEGTA